MMSLIFLLLLIAMVSAFIGKKNVGYAFFAASVIIGLYWFHHHATDSLSILL
ncbi:MULTISPECIES: DUF5993 family protein [Photobacterium]|uniref:N-acetylglutamate synthase n=1 Tax=Photobacterium angustum (strain S14 / CCUG 15956) TaxID=314292 RepID=Q1ZLK9_PHOAS|nr:MULTISPECIES: DUF5993 family protein [Photobacterium]EAR53479.1 hypothetical protein SKA34_21519 [Photobacterium sp. SKA34]EAS63008.1 N-acetylglutamate synthase [Vibrio angustum S14] [Photobacterium angustum S14]KJG04461.1 membrane protein [Photobacterium angustum]KJG15526.1 membrane protein [Photobacterium angustum]KJG20756.1 membrane protein [Photobacterium angustum]